MRRSPLRLAFVPIAMLAGLVLLAGERASADSSTAETQKAIAEAKRLDPSINRFFTDSVGYVVFPHVGKGALVVGGAHGNGILYEKGRPVGKASLTQVSVGAQAGGQEYAQIIFFQTPETLASFKENNFSFAAQTSAVALKSGAAANAKYTNGVAVFSFGQGGLMVEASVGGQKFHYEPFPHPPATHG